MLTVRNLSTRFGAARVVDEVSFSVDEGVALGIVGESGSGKSVTALSILRLVPEPAGHIEEGSSVIFRGSELLGLDAESMRRVRGAGIAMIFQEPMSSLNPVLTVGEQVAESIRLHRGVGKREARGRAIELLRLVGIPAPAERADAWPHELSGGQRQRVMIAIALAGEPDLLIADEPTTALDVTVQAQILDLLDDLRRRLGMALILITHDLGVVARVCDRVAVMYAGRIVEEGPVDRIFSDPRHPYTRGLLRATPRVEADAAPPEPIPGQPPAAGEWPRGCRFHPRCTHAWSRCAGEEPGMLEVGDGRRSRCWLEIEAGHREDRDAIVAFDPTDASAPGDGTAR